MQFLSIAGKWNGSLACREGSIITEGRFSVSEPVCVNVSCYDLWRELQTTDKNDLHNGVQGLSLIWANGGPGAHGIAFNTSGIADLQIVLILDPTEY